MRRPAPGRRTSDAHPGSTAEPARPGRAGLANLAAVAGNRALREALREPDHPAVARSVGAPIQRRSPNPLPSPRTGTAVPGGGIYAEHHLVPHATLETFWRVANEVVGSRDLIGASASVLQDWGTVTVGAVVSAGLIKDEWLNDEDVVAETGGDADALRGQLMDVAFSAERVEAIQAAWGRNRGNAALRSLARGLPTFAGAWEHARAGAPEPEAGADEEPDLGMVINLVAPFYEWMPGNLVVGPEGAIRAHDPHDNYDVEAAGALSAEHRTAIETMRDQMAAAIAGGDGQLVAVRAALDAIRVLGTTYSAKTIPEVQPPGGDAPGTPYWRQTDAGWELVV
ncbi:MAG: hypothetical protein KC472_09105 [Dehalococcoidia bacterium]|nr:hypothetical protein [Dehalococcoidia bacterium]